MIFYTLPSSPSNIFKNIQITTCQKMPPVFISHSICNYLYDIKCKITSREKSWDVYKKYTNPYEYIHTVVPQRKKSVSKYKPISRSYFKMVEMIAEFKLDESSISLKMPVDNFAGCLWFADDSPSNPPSLENHSIPPLIFRSGIDHSSKFPKKTSNPMRTFHLAEGPGGFIEAICNKRNNLLDEYYGMTIILDETDDNVPAWHKTGHFLSHNPNVNLEYGIDGTGNLLHIANFEHCVKKYGGTMDLVTADGGFDFSKDFNRQEVSIANLLWGQVCYALCLQKLGGNFVLKIFDIFYEHTVHILYILSAFYEKVHVCKLKTSRVGNSEKYVVCKNFRFSSSTDFYPFIIESFAKITSTIPQIDSTSTNIFNRIDIFAKEPHQGILNELYIWKLLTCKIPLHFTKQVEDINVIFGQQQIENIHYTISLIDKQPKTDKLEQLIRQNTTKCINWCMDHSILYNNFAITTANMFDCKSMKTVAIR